MQTYTAVSYETTDIESLCAELAEQISKNVTFGKRTIGILMCDVNIDFADVAKRVSEMYSFDIIGGTVMGFLRLSSEEDISASFMIITGDDELVYSYALSEPINGKNKFDVITKTYNEGIKSLNCEPKVILGLQPLMIEVTQDDVIQTVDKLSGKIPFYGAITSHELGVINASVFVNGVCYHDRVLLSFLGGGIRPLFAIANVQTGISPKKAIITKSAGNVIYTVGDITFLDFIRQSGIKIDPNIKAENIVPHYVSSPVIVRRKNMISKDIPSAFIIAAINFEDGSVALGGNVEDGDEVSLYVIKKEDILQATKACLDEMLDKMAKNSTDNYKYSTIFSTSCGARYLVLLGDTSQEGEVIRKYFLEHNISMCCIYASGEACPTFVNDDHTAGNRFHNFSITLMAI